MQFEQAAKELFDTHPHVKIDVGNIRDPEYRRELLVVLVNSPGLQSVKVDSNWITLEAREISALSACPALTELRAHRSRIGIE